MSLTSHADISRRSILAAAAAGATVVAVKIPDSEARGRHQVGLPTCLFTRRGTADGAGRR